MVRYSPILHANARIIYIYITFFFNKENAFNLFSYIIILESELVSGFMTEHSAVIFVFFFLAEYASIVLICILISILFMGGYLYDLTVFIYALNGLNMIGDYVYSIIASNYESIFNYYYHVDVINNIKENYNNSLPIYLDINNSLYEGLFYSISLGIKSCIMIFIFIWARASFPRIRFDQLMSFCWTVLLPVVISFIILVPCIIYSFDIISINFTLL